MPTDTSGSAPHTAIIPGQGASSVTYTLPQGLYQYVQSVVATIDTTASVAVTALLTVRDDAGEVVADKEQGQTLDAGGAGRRATWALRLTDETTAGGAATTGEEFFAATGDVVTAGGTKNLTWTKSSGSTLLDLTTPTQPSVVASGVYAFSVTVAVVPSTAAPTNGKTHIAQLTFNDFSIPAGMAAQTMWDTTSPSDNSIFVSAVRSLTAGTTLQVIGGNGDVIAVGNQLAVYLERLS